MKRLNLKTLCIAFLLLDVLVAAVLCWSVFSSGRNVKHERDVLAERVGITQQMSPRQQQEKLAQEAGEAARHVSMRSEVTAEEGKIALYLSNAEDNECSVSVEIVLLGTDDRIAESGTVEPGWRLEELELERELDKGEHFCLVRCSFYTMDGNVFLGTTARQLLVTVP